MVSESGTALASLVLGQVNAFTIDIRKNVIQPRPHCNGLKLRVITRNSVSH